MGKQVVHVGNAIDVLRSIEAESVHMVCTSPPYFGLRSYGTIGQIWGGDEACDHEWSDPLPPFRPVEKRTAEEFSRNSTLGPNRDGLRPTNAGHQVKTTLQPRGGGTVCTRCQAWRGELGSEPNVAQYVANLVAVFAEVRRVLRNDGTLWLNLSGSYNSSSQANNGRSSSAKLQSQKKLYREGEDGETWPGHRPLAAEYKPKDLMQIPHRVSMALQADGWVLRAELPWIKRSCLPESVTDRPTTALEWVFLFSKRAKYYWDAEAVKRPLSPMSHYGGVYHVDGKHSSSRNDTVTLKAAGHVIVQADPSGRQWRNTDLYFDSLDALIAAERAYLADLEAMRERGGLLLDEDGLPIALDVNPGNFKEAHFATFPPKLITPMVKASTPEVGCCAACRTPYRRITERASVERGEARHPTGRAHVPYGKVPGSNTRGVPMRAVLGERWEPGCSCQTDQPPVPATVLDCFVGSGTTLVVASRLGRNGIGIELSPVFSAMAERRIREEGSPLFGDVQTVATAPEPDDARQAAMWTEGPA